MECRFIPLIPMLINPMIQTIENTGDGQTRARKKKKHCMADSPKCYTRKTRFVTFGTSINDSPVNANEIHVDDDVPEYAKSSADALFASLTPRVPERNDRNMSEDISDSMPSRHNRFKRSAKGAMKRRRLKLHYTMSLCRDNPGSQLEDDVDIGNGPNLIGKSSPKSKNFPVLRLSIGGGLGDDGDMVHLKPSADNGDRKSNLSEGEYELGDDQSKDIGGTLH